MTSMALGPVTTVPPLFLHCPLCLCMELVCATIVLFPELQGFNTLQPRHSLPPSGMLEARSSIEIVGELIHEIGSLVRARESGDAFELDRLLSRYTGFLVQDFARVQCLLAWFEYLFEH